MNRKIVFVLALCCAASAHAQQLNDAKIAALEQQGIQEAQAGQCDEAEARVRLIARVRPPSAGQPIDPALAELVMATEQCDTYRKAAAQYKPPSGAAPATAAPGTGNTVSRETALFNSGMQMAKSGKCAAAEFRARQLQYARRMPVGTADADIQALSQAIEQCKTQSQQAAASASEPLPAAAAPAPVPVPAHPKKLHSHTTTHVAAVPAAPAEPSAIDDGTHCTAIVKTLGMCNKSPNDAKCRPIHDYLSHSLMDIDAQASSKGEQKVFDTSAANNTSKLNDFIAGTIGTCASVGENASDSTTLLESAKLYYKTQKAFR